MNNLLIKVRDENKMPVKMLEEVYRCYICGNTRAKLLIPARDRWCGLPGEFNIMKCLDCGLIYTNPRPTPESISFYYPDSYGPHQYKKHAGTAQSNMVKEKRIKSLIKAVLDTRSHYLPAFTPGSRLLEIGCSYGSFLEQAHSKGWDVYGVEIAEEPVKFGREVLGLDIYQGTLEKAGFPDNFFDVVTGWMVLEHLHDPVKTLKEIKRIIKPGGTVAFGVPNAGSWEFKVFGANWFALEVPRHLSHFTVNSIRELFTRSGFVLEKIYYQKNISNIPASLALSFEDRWGKNKASNFLRKISNSGGFYKFSFPIAAFLSYFKMTGRMTVVGTDVKNNN